MYSIIGENKTICDRILENSSKSHMKSGVKLGARRPKAGARLVYLKSLLCGCMCVCVCVCVDVCVSAPQAMNNYSRETESE